MPKRFTIAIVMLLAVLGLAACGDGGGTATSTTGSADTTTTSRPDPTEFAGYVRTPPLVVSEVTFPTIDGDRVPMVADADGLRLVYFGYSTCPDVCPATLGYVKMALAELPDTDRARVQVDVITIDPTVDTPDRWGPYVRQFVPEAHVIRDDDPAELRAAAKTFGADYSIRYDEAGKRQVGHTDDLYAVDDTGTIVLAWPFGTPPIDIETDLRRLLAGERPAADA